jgi:putative flippase GtrA
MRVRKELFRFAFAGGLAVGVDLGSYLLLLAFTDGAAVDACKGASFLLGTIVAYFINKLWTFGSQGYTGAEVFRFAVVYGCSFLLNVVINGMTLDWLVAGLPQEAAYHNLIAFVVATGFSSATNFVGMKLWVFRKPA